MSLAMSQAAKPVKLEANAPIKEEVFVIDPEVEEQPIHLATVWPLKFKTPVDEINLVGAKPSPSTLRPVLAEVVVHQSRPSAQPFKVEQQWETLRPLSSGKIFASSSSCQPRQAAFHSQGSCLHKSLG